MCSGENYKFDSYKLKYNQMEKGKFLQKVLDGAIDQKKIFGTSFAVQYNDETWAGASGNLTVEKPYFIASTTKLFATAIIMKLRSTGQLSLDDLIRTYLENNILQGLHFYNNREYSGEISIRQLLSHTSGLPDYFQLKDAKGSSLKDDLFGGLDQCWSFEQSIERAKVMKPLFAPGAKSKAHYSDTNFQLLGKIIGTITGKSFSENCNELIIRPLKMSNTYLYLDETDSTPQPFHCKSKVLHIPKAMASFGPDGGMVSTSGDMLKFTESFFTGALFPSAYIAEMQQWNRIFFPMQAGVGIHKFQLPRIFDPMGKIPSFIGHSGLSGALAYYSPSKNICIAGTVNQVAHPDLSFRIMIKLAQVILKN